MVHGCDKFLPALAWLFCLALPGSWLARFAYFLADLCIFYSIYTECYSTRSSERMKWILDLIIRSSNATGGADKPRARPALEGWRQAGNSFLDDGEGTALLSELPKRGNIFLSSSSSFDRSNFECKFYARKIRGVKGRRDLKPHFHVPPVVVAWIVVLTKKMTVELRDLIVDLGFLL